MKKIILITFFFLFQNLFSFEKEKIKLTENEKLEGTYSIETNTNETLHILIIKKKDTKKYILKPFYIFSDQKTKELDSFVTDEIPSIIGNHVNTNITTLCLYDEKKETMTVVDFDSNNGKNTFSKINDLKKADLIFNQNGKTILVNFIKWGHKVTTKTIIDSHKIDDAKFEVSEEMHNEFTKIASNNPDEINQNEFVANGSINEKRVYLTDNVLYFTNNRRGDETDVFAFDLNDDKSISKNTFAHNFPKNSKDENTYVYGNNLLAISSSKEDVVIKTYDLKTNLNIKNFSLKSDLKGIIDANDFDKFLLEEKKENLKNTITVNKTLNDKLKVRIDRVSKTYYHYYYDWWFHQQFMMQQMQMQQIQQMQMPTGRGFGPNPYDCDDFLFLNKLTKLQSIEFVVDQKFELSNNSNEETQYKNFDKDFILEEFESNKNIKQFTTVFLKNELRFVYQDKKSKEIIIDIKKLN